MKVPINEIKDYLSKNEIPKEFQLNDFTYIKDTSVFIDTNLKILERNKGNKNFMPYYDRLCDFYKKIKEER